MTCGFFWFLFAASKLLVDGFNAFLTFLASNSYTCNVIFASGVMVKFPCLLQLINFHVSVQFRW